MRKSTRYSLFVSVLLLGALAIAILLRKAAPPEAARLLPESDAIVYLNLKPLRLATHFDRNPVPRSPDFQAFMDATGIVVERDLDEAAFALHRMTDPSGPNGPVAYSEVFEGRFDGARLASYLASIATARESYLGHLIYTIPVGVPSGAAGRQLRVAQLGYDTVAASNMPTPEQIHSILDRYRAAASPFSGSSLLGARYREVPLLSSAWAIGHIALPFSESGDGRITVLGLTLPIPPDTTFVASLRFTSALHLRIEEIAPSSDQAARSAEAFQTLLNLFKGIQQAQSQARLQAQAPSPGDEAIAQAVDSIHIESYRDRTLLTATLPPELLHQLSAAAPR